MDTSAHAASPELLGIVVGGSRCAVWSARSALVVFPDFSSEDGWPGVVAELAQGPCGCRGAHESDLQGWVCQTRLGVHQVLIPMCAEKDSAAVAAQGELPCELAGPACRNTWQPGGCAAGRIPSPVGCTVSLTAWLGQWQLLPAQGVRLGSLPTVACVGPREALMAAPQVKSPVRCTSCCVC